MIDKVIFKIIVSIQLAMKNLLLYRHRKPLLLLALLFIGFKSYAQFTEIQFYPNDSVCKRAISFNKDTIYAIGNVGYCFSKKFELYKSIDKGLTWALVNHVNKDYSLVNFISFSDSSHLVIAKHAIYNTYDAFDTAICIMCNFQTYPTSIKAINKDTIIIFDLGHLYVSHDGFNTWDTVTINSLTTKHAYAVDEISIINDSVWIAYLNKDCALIKTTDAGATWKMIKDFSAYNFCDEYSYANFSTENIGLLRFKKTIYSTLDGATTFQKVLTIRKKSEFLEMNSFSSGWTYIVTKNGLDSSNTIYYSKNFGATWDSLNYYYHADWEDFYNLHYYNDSLIFALTYNGKLFGIDMNSTGINNATPSTALIKIYPNPSIDVVNIEIEGISTWHYNIYDPIGRLIQQKTSNAKKCSIDISTFSRGIYYIDIIDLKDFNRITKKIIKL